MEIIKLYNILSKDEKDELFCYIKSEKSKEINVSDFLLYLEKNKKGTLRLKNILSTGYNLKDIDLINLSIDEIDFRLFMMQRNAGKKTWQEFLNLKSTYKTFLLNN